MYPFSLRQIARYLPHHRSENASKTHPKSSHDKFKTASNPEICGENPITNREVPTNVWGHSVAGGFLSFYFCVRNFKTL